MSMFLGEPLGQSLLQFGELGFAFLLSALIGVERQFRQKSAGLRTCTLVGLASALIILISKYGFTDVLQPERVVLDPSRIAAQIVSGIGFIGGGVIFVRKDLVRGLTTAATVWLVSAVGMACGAGLPLLALAVTIGHFLVVGVFPLIEQRLPKSKWASTTLRVAYWDGRGVLRDVMTLCTQQGFSVSGLRVDSVTNGDVQSGFQTGKEHGKGEDLGGSPPKGIVTLLLQLRGGRPLPKLLARLNEIDGVVAAHTDDATSASE